MYVVPNAAVATHEHVFLFFMHLKDATTWYPREQLVETAKGDAAPTALCFSRGNWRSIGLASGLHYSCPFDIDATNMARIIFLVALALLRGPYTVPEGT